MRPRTVGQNAADKFDLSRRELDHMVIGEGGGCFARLGLPGSRGPHAWLNLTSRAEATWLACSLTPCPVHGQQVLQLALAVAAEREPDVLRLPLTGLARRIMKGLTSAASAATLAMVPQRVPVVLCLALDHCMIRAPCLMKMHVRHMRHVLYMLGRFQLFFSLYVN